MPARAPGNERAGDNWVLLPLLAGCNTVADLPEISPDRFAPASAQPMGTIAGADRPSSRHGRFDPADTAGRTAIDGHELGQPYDLAALIDVALDNNPRTRQRLGNLARRRGDLRRLAVAVLSTVRDGIGFGLRAYPVRTSRHFRRGEAVAER